MRIYMDTCSLQRPLDDKRQPRISIEAEAVLAILQMVEAGNWLLLSSEALNFEIDRIPDQFRSARTREVLKLAHDTIALTDEIESMAKTFYIHGIRAVDALHLACAMHAPADFFCTCDDQLLKKSRAMGIQEMRIVSPLELAAEIDK